MKLYVIALALTGLISIDARARNCHKGKPCGNSCISKNDVCHKNAGSASISSEAPAPSNEAAPEAPASSGRVKDCKKGKRCGDTCIPMKATCHQ